MKTLDQLSEYVDTVADGDENIIVLSQFVPTKGSASDQPSPTQLNGIVISHPSSGVLQVECGKQDQVQSYICIITAGAPIPSSFNINEAGQLFIGPSTVPGNTETGTGPVTGTNPFAAILDFNPSRKKTIIGLTPGTTYYFVFIGINASGVSQFSTPVAAICT
ncbi:MAG: hypothetical protein K9J17_17825 [Flavobacteriales bacterium]|nr:hypothetical protein [Flavobacteriales bacterium]